MGRPSVGDPTDAARGRGGPQRLASALDLGAGGQRHQPAAIPGHALARRHDLGGATIGRWADRSARRPVDRPPGGPSVGGVARGRLDARRREAGQYLRFARGTRDALGPGFRPAERRNGFGGRPLRDRLVPLHGAGVDHLDASRRHPQRHLQPRRGAVRVALRPSAVRRQDAGRSGRATQAGGPAAISRNWLPICRRRSPGWCSRCSPRIRCGVPTIRPIWSDG